MGIIPPRLKGNGWWQAIISSGLLMGVLDINLIIERGQVHILGYKKGTGPMFLYTRAMHDSISENHGSRFSGFRGC